MLFKPFFLAALLASSASALYTRNDKGEKAKKYVARSIDQRMVLIPSIYRPRVVPGIAFDRFITIWLENTDFLSAAADRQCLSLQILAKLIFFHSQLQLINEAGYSFDQLLCCYTPFGTELCG